MAMAPQLQPRVRPLVTKSSRGTLKKSSMGPPDSAPTIPLSTVMTAITVTDPSKFSMTGIPKAKVMLLPMNPMELYELIPML